MTPAHDQEWIVANGLGGYASGPVRGRATRRYHSTLVAALPPPHGRVLMLDPLREVLRSPDGVVTILQDMGRFQLENGLPIWRFEIGRIVLEKRLVMPAFQNTTHVIYRVVSSPKKFSLRFDLAMRIRPHDSNLSDGDFSSYAIRWTAAGMEVIPGEGLPTLRMTWKGGRRSRLVVDPRVSHPMPSLRETERGYPDSGTLWMPGWVQFKLLEGDVLAMTASAEPWGTIHAISPEEALKIEQSRRKRLVEQADPRVQTQPDMILAADAFVIRPAGRLRDRSRAESRGLDLRTVIAGYHWFTDWGRDTMIALEGLLLTTGRHREAAAILHAFADHARDGVIPNYFPDGQDEGVYHTADASLWFVHAVHRYVQISGDRAILDDLLPTIRSIIDHHLRGTRFGIGVDPTDGLLRQGADGYQLTWMDAKVGDWVVTPRRGKAVEINALWYNALRITAGWLKGKDADSCNQHADRARDAFNRRFPNPASGFLFDVVDGETGDDLACRPNQLLAISLDHAVLNRTWWPQVIATCRDRLLTPVGLRSLAPGEPNYQPCYEGDINARDSAYHQGTVWAWLIGPYLDALLKLDPANKAEARRILEGFRPHIDTEAALGTISEIFDADPPPTPRGCVAQAWSVAEWLRCWARTETRDTNETANQTG